MNRLAILVAAALALCVGTAEASQQGVVAIGKWKTMDTCSKLAQAAFPDFSAESNAKREAKLAECLNANNLPPRQSLSQPQPQPR